MYTKRTISWIAICAIGGVCMLTGTQKPAADPVLNVDLNRRAIAISPTLYGLFFEEINHAGDGGLYAEMVHGRTFEDPKSSAWSLRTRGAAQGSLRIDAEEPLNQAHRQSLRIQVSAPGPGSEVAAINEGYWGMALAKGAAYRLSFYARASADFKGGLEARLESVDGKVYASKKLDGVTPAWRKFEATLESAATDPSARLAIAATTPGVIWLNVVSLFPQDTWKRRPNGLRPDIAGLLADLEPAFLRFPGGCYVEGDRLRDAFRWKNTIGDIAGRPGHPNLNWGYWSTDGLGYHEYLQLAEDLGAEPLFVVNAGMAHGEVAPKERMDEWVQDALDAIEYANGPVDTKWGGLRAKNGHPKPFGMKYLEIGNENGGPAYEERYAMFHKALKARYPEILLISDTEVTSAPMDIVDHHIYSVPDQLRFAGTRYDSYDRKGPKVFVGEYACNHSVGKGNLRGALAEAVYMIGLERNSDVVRLASYAPLLYNVNNRGWPVNLIGYDSARVFGTPSYWVQWLFSRNRGDVVLPSALECEKEPLGPDIERGLIGIGTAGAQAEFKDIQVTAGSKTEYTSDFSQGMRGFRGMRGAQWDTKDGVLRQVSAAPQAIAITGSGDWTDYTVTAKVRKTGGDGSVLVLFRLRNLDHYFWLRIGGWGNTATAVERKSGGNLTRLSNGLPGPIETGRWYDIKIDVNGPSVDAFVDGKPAGKIEDAYGEESMLPAMTAIANWVESTREVVLKVVNNSDRPRKTAVRLRGAGGLAPEGSAVVLTSASADDENTLEEPRKVSPRTSTLAGVREQFDYTFPAHSLTVLRLKTR